MQVVKVLEEKLEVFAKQERVPGMAYSYVDTARGRISCTIGGLVAGRTFKVRDSTQFPVGSLGKSVVAIGIMKLVEAGKLRLDMPVAELIPEIPIQNPWKSHQPLLLVHLLEHTSGFDEMHFNEYYDFTFRGAILLESALRRNASSKILRWPPGTLPSYSNINYALAAYLIEKITQQHFDEWLKEEVLHPLGMKDSYFHRGNHFDDPLMAQGHKPDGKTIVEPFSYWYSPALGLRSNAVDMSKLLSFFLHRGKVNGEAFLSEASLERMERVETGWGRAMGTAEGFGLGLEIEAVQGSKRCSHAGGVDGYSAWMEYFPEEGKGLVVLTNREGLGRFEKGGDEGGLSSTLILGVGRPSNFPLQAMEGGAVLEDWSGTYLLVNPRNQLFAFYDDLHSSIQITEQPEGDQFNQSKHIYLPDGKELNCFPVRQNRCDCIRGRNASIFGGVVDENVAILKFNGKYYRRVPATWQWLKYVVYDIGWWWLLLASFFLPFACYDAIRSRTPNNSLILMAVVTGLPFWMAWWGFEILRSGDFLALGTLSFSSLTVFLLSIMIPLLFLLSVYLFGRMRRENVHHHWRVYYGLTMLFNGLLSIYMLMYGLIGLMTWAR